MLFCHIQTKSEKRLHWCRYTGCWKSWRRKEASEGSCACWQCCGLRWFQMNWSGTGLTSSPACSGSAAWLGLGPGRKHQSRNCFAFPDSSKSYWLLWQHTSRWHKHPSNQSFRHCSKRGRQIWMECMLQCENKDVLESVELTPVPPTGSLDVQQHPRDV